MRIIVLLFVFFSGVLLGQNASLHEVTQCASNYFLKYRLNKTPTGTIMTYGMQNCPDMYVFNMSGGGWIMISGIYDIDPVLAVGFSGSFDTLEKMPEALKTIFDEYQYQISAIRRENRNSTVRHIGWDDLLSIQSTPRDGYEPDVLLLDMNGKRGKIRWQQSRVNGNSNCLDISYNKFVPTWNPYMGILNDCNCGRPPAGCGPVAMGQVMWYWQWPKKSPYSYRGGYNWNLMPNKIVDTTDWREADEIAYLLKDCGTAMSAVYTCGGTFAEEPNFIYAWQLYGYEQVTIATRSFWDYGYSWIELVRSEIDNQRPVVICGYKNYPFKGHYFVVDGYLRDDVNKFHLNLGWGNNWESVFVNLYDIDFTQNNHHHTYNSHRTAFVGISPTYNDTVVNKAFYEKIYRTDYELSLRKMALPSEGEGLIVEPGAELTLVAGKEIVLQPGFEAKEGSEVSIIVDTGLVNRMPIIVSEWPTTVEEESDGLYVDVRNANSYELTVRDVDSNIKYQTAGLVRNNPVRIWNRDYDYDPSVTYDCTVRFKNNFGRALQHTFRINAEETRNNEYEMRMTRGCQGEDVTLKVQPNPASGWFSICLDGMSDCDIVLYNAKGEPCLRDVNINNGYYYIDASAYPPGIYFVTVRSGDVEKSAKVIVR